MAKVHSSTKYLEAVIIFPEIMEKNVSSFNFSIHWLQLNLENVSSQSTHQNSCLNSGFHQTKLKQWNLTFFRNGKSAGRILLCGSSVSSIRFSSLSESDRSTRTPSADMKWLLCLSVEKYCKYILSLPFPRNGKQQFRKGWWSEFTVLLFFFRSFHNSLSSHNFLQFLSFFCTCPHKDLCSGW